MRERSFAFTASLFFIGALHILIFWVFQIPGNFLLDNQPEHLIMYGKAVVYAVAIITALFYQSLARRFPLRKILYSGLLLNALGLLILWIEYLVPEEGPLFLAFLNMLFFGAALSLVTNTLIVYTILEHPKKLGFWITALFIFFNVGIMISPVILDAFTYLSIQSAIYPFLLLLIATAAAFVRAYFFDPPIPEHLGKLRKGSLLWKEMHYRLALFVVAVVAFGLTEATFPLWGFVQAKHVVGGAVRAEITSFFWIFMILGQTLLLAPLYFFAARKIFYLLAAVCIGALIYLPEQNDLPGLLLGLAVGGLGCSAMLPILLSIVEREILSFSTHPEIFPYVEAAVSIVIASYIFGSGLTDFWIEWTRHTPIEEMVSPFYRAIFFIGTTAALVFCLNATKLPRK